jgi:hypothetical protein
VNFYQADTALILSRTEQILDKRFCKKAKLREELAIDP